MASISRHRGAQPSCRRHVGYQVIGTPAIRDQPPPTALPQEFLGDLATARPSYDNDRDPGGARGPQPRARLPLTPPGFVHGDRPGGRLLQAHQRTQTDRHAKQLVHDTLGGALGQVRRARAPRGHRLHPWAKSAGGHARGPRGSGGLPTDWADQAMQLRLGDERLHRWELGDLMPWGLVSFPVPGVLAAGAALRLDWNDHRHLLERDPRARRGLLPRAWGGSLDRGREEGRASCCSHSIRCWTVASNRWTAVSHAVTRASREQLSAWTPAGMRSHSAGGKGPSAFLDRAMPGHGQPLASMSHIDHVNAYSQLIRCAEHLHLAEMNVQAPNPPGRFSLRLGVYPPSEVLQIDGTVIMSPLPPMLSEDFRAAGLLGSTGHTPLRRYDQPLRHPLVSGRLPRVAGYTAYLAPPISRRDEEVFARCCARPCHHAVAPTPPAWFAVSASLRRSMRPSPSRLRSRPLGLRTFGARCAFTFVTAR